MDALLKSFVGKVRVRMAEAPLPPNDLLRGLLPALGATDPDVLAGTVALLHDACCGRAVADAPLTPAEGAGVLAALVRMAGANPALGADTRARVGELFMHLQDTALAPRMPLRWPWAETRVLLAWYAGTGAFLQLCQLLHHVGTTEPGVLPALEVAELLTPALCAAAVCARPDLCRAGYLALRATVCDAPAAEHFWAAGGAAFLGALGTLRVRHPHVLSGVLLALLAHLAPLAPRGVADLLADPRTSAAALVVDVTCGDVDVAAEGDDAGADADASVTAALSTLLAPAAVRAAWGANQGLVRLYAAHLATVAPQLPAAHQAELLEHLLDMNLHHLDRPLLSKLWACSAKCHARARRHIACATLQALDPHEALAYLATIVPLNDGTCPGLDAALCAVFAALRTVPGDATYPLVVHGAPPNVLFHTVERLAPPPLARGTAFAHAVHSFLEEEVRSGRALEATGGLQYCQDLVARYGLDACMPTLGGIDAAEGQRFAACVPSCPVTLQRMHCPVLASDGHTYELAALLGCLAKSAKSPLTRETLKPWAVFNRAAYDTDKQLTSALHNKPRVSRTTRRWQPPGSAGAGASARRAWNA